MAHTTDINHDLETEFAQWAHSLGSVLHDDRLVLFFVCCVSLQSFYRLKSLLVVSLIKILVFLNIPSFQRLRGRAMKGLKCLL